MSLAVQNLVQWQGADGKSHVVRVLVLDRQTDQVTIIDIEKKNTTARPTLCSLSELEDKMLNCDATLLKPDPYGIFRQKDEDLAKHYKAKWPRHRERRDKRWRIIEPIVTALQDRLFDSSELGPLVEEVFLDTKVSKTNIYDYLRCYWQRGMCRNALLPDYRGCGHGRDAKTAYTTKLGRPSAAIVIADAQPGINIDDRIREFFRRGTQLYYANREACSLIRAYNKILDRFFYAYHEEREGGIRVPILLDPEKRPTFRQYQYWFYKQPDLKQIAIARMGKRRFNLRYRPVPGRHRSSLGPIGPGSQFQIDATFPDVYLVGELERKIIGRPTLYFVTDFWSELITGISIGLDPPSWGGAMLALENMVHDKVEYCSSLGLSIEPWEWPSRHFPRRLCGDRGEMLSKASDALASSFNIIVSNTAAYRPDWKALVEREFGLLEEGCIKWIPGHTNGWDDEPGDRDRRLDACMSLREFTYYVVDFVIEYNTTHRVTDEALSVDMIRDGVEPYPNELWNWGITHLSGSLHTEDDEAVIQRNLLPSDELSVTGEGLMFGGLHYTCAFADQNQWLERARLRPGREPWHEPILYDPRTPKWIFLNIDKSNPPIRCELEPRDARFATCTWADVRHYFALRRLQDQERAELTRPDHAEHEARREKKVLEAKEKTQAAQTARGPESKRARLAGMRENRKTELQQHHEEHQWTLGTEDQPTGDTLEDQGRHDTTDTAAADTAYQSEVLDLLSQAYDEAVASPSDEPLITETADTLDVVSVPNYHGED